MSRNVCHPIMVWGCIRFGDGPVGQGELGALRLREQVRIPDRRPARPTRSRRAKIRSRCRQGIAGAAIRSPRRGYGRPSTRPCRLRAARSRLRHTIPSGARFRSGRPRPFPATREGRARTGSRLLRSTWPLLIACPFSRPVPARQGADSRRRGCAPPSPTIPPRLPGRAHRCASAPRPAPSPAWLPATP